ncbi:methyltransferase domain-containing protein [Parabacteroides sp. ASD2025]|uniref:methyltransferase domain-containing protein n=1 Tax=Parabacteroides sp. ASD2025 TaxID=3415987 RepID=UPI003CF6817E
MKQNQNLITGSVLEIAESTYSKQFGHDISLYEVLHYDDSNKKATIVGDLTKPETLPRERIDCFICTQTLNFIFDLPKAVEGSYKVLKQGGTLLCTVDISNFSIRYGSLGRLLAFYGFIYKEVDGICFR